MLDVDRNEMEDKRRDRMSRDRGSSREGHRRGMAPPTAGKASIVRGEKGKAFWCGVESVNDTTTARLTLRHRIR